MLLDHLNIIVLPRLLNQLLIEEVKFNSNYPARISEFHRIGQEVEQNLQESSLITIDESDHLEVLPLIYFCKELHFHFICLVSYHLESLKY
jgi:hypothetical protein